MRTNLTILLTVLALFSPATNAAQEAEQYVIGGKVLDYAHKPVSGASIKLFDERGQSIGKGDSGSDGAFSVEHRLSRSCVIEVVPPERTHLAQALIDNVPGEGNRNFIVTLQRGFVVSGRVVHDDRALKGVAINVVSAETGATGDAHVHGGGKAIAARDGRFHMTLTPGEKKMEVLNGRYSDLVSHVDRQISVTADTEIGDIQLPSAH